MLIDRPFVAQYWKKKSYDTEISSLYMKCYLIKIYLLNIWFLNLIKSSIFETRNKKKMLEIQNNLSVH